LNLILGFRYRIKSVLLVMVYRTGRRGRNRNRNNTTDNRYETNHLELRCNG